MASRSPIEWTEATWNPVAGCTMVSPACTNCYAMRMAGRLEAMRQRKYLGTTHKSGGRFVWSGQISLDERALTIPHSWRKERRIFVNSMSDLFHEAVPPDFIRRVWEVMKVASWHTYQILTKRPERMAHVLSDPCFEVLRHVWLGTSVENADYVHRIESLRRTPATLRFLSLEPLLGPLSKLNLAEIDWVIVGGESGPKARPMDASWVSEIHVQCREQGVPFFFKQWGGWNKKVNGRTLRGRTWDEFPRVSTRPAEATRPAALPHV